MLIIIIFRRPFFHLNKALQIFSVLIFFCLCSKAQKRSRYEWFWALGHPVAAVKVKIISKRCYRLYNSDSKLKSQLDSFSNGGKLDAFRHVFFMAAFAQKVKVKKLRKLGEAHEKASYKIFLNSKIEDGEIPDSLSAIMDLKNNGVGFTIGQQHKHLEPEELKNVVIKEIISGKAVIMKRKSNGIYLDCSDRPVNPDFFIGKWFIPKCLVSSNFSYSKN